MKYRQRYFVIFTLLVLLPALTATAQQSSSSDKSLERTLQKLSKDAAISYVSPIVSAFGSDLDAGWFHRAPSARFFGFDFEVGLVAMGTFFSKENKSFSSSGIFQFDSAQAAILTNFMKNDPQYGLALQQREAVQRAVIQKIRGVDFSVGIAGATVVGKESDSIRVRFGGNTFTVTDPNTGQTRTVNVPSNIVALPVGGLLNDFPALPLAAPQLTIGTILGSQFTFRYLPQIEINKEIGKLKYFGFGIQHNPGVWLGDPLPLEVSVGFFTQTLKLGTLFEAKATAFGVNASKRIGWGALNLTPYAGFMFESSSMTFTYNYTLDTPTGPVPQKISFKLEGQNKSRLTLGASIKLLILNFNADYNFGKFKSASAGVMFII